MQSRLQHKIISIITIGNIFRGNRRGPSLQNLIFNKFPFKNIGKLTSYLVGLQVKILVQDIFI